MHFLRGDIILVRFALMLHSPISRTMAYIVLCLRQSNEAFNLKISALPRGKVSTS